MDAEIIVAVCISLAAFSLITVVLLRFTSSPGLRFWPFVAIVLLSYPVALGYAALYWFLRLPGIGGAGGRFAWACYITSVAVVAPTAVWAALRFFRAVRERHRRIWWLVTPCVVLALIYACFWLLRVPARELDQTWYTTHHEYTRVPQTDVPWRVVARAHIDNFVAPVTYSRRMNYWDAWQESPDVIYIRFLADMHAAVVYCWSPRDGKLLWKAWEDHSA